MTCSQAFASLILSTTLAAAATPALTAVALVPTSGLAVTSFIVGGVSAVAGGGGLYKKTFGGGWIQGLGGLGLGVLDPDAAQYYSGVFSITYPETLLEVVDVGWFGEFAADPSLYAPQVSTSGFMTDPTDTLIQLQAPNPQLTTTVTNIPGLLTITFDAGPDGLNAPADHFNFLGFAFRNISDTPLQWSFRDPNPNVFQNPASQSLVCKPPGFLVPVTCGDDSPVPYTFRVFGVPEPQTWALMILGFASLGAMARRRRAALAA